MPNSDIMDTGKGTDKPKGFVRWTMFAFWTAIISLSAYCASLNRKINNRDAECQDRVERILISTQKTIDAIRVDYANKLEARINRIEKIETRVDKIPKQ